MTTIRNRPPATLTKPAETRNESRPSPAAPRTQSAASRPGLDTFASSFQPSVRKPLVQLQPQANALRLPAQETGVGAGPAVQDINGVPPEPPPAEYLSMSSGSGVNLRLGASTAGNPLTTLRDGWIVQVTPDSAGETRKDGWVHVSCTDSKGVERSGWVSEELTQKATAADATSQQTQLTATGAETQPELTAADEEKLAAATELYVNQFAAEKEVMFPTGAVDAAGAPVLKEGDGRNANCGPTSTLMALRAQGLEVPALDGITSGGTDGEDIQAVRYAMYNDVVDGLDGVQEDADGKITGYDQSENSGYTGLKGAERAVAAAKGDSGYVTPLTAKGIEDQMKLGRAVILAGDFMHDVPVKAEPGQPADANGSLLQDGVVVTESKVKPGLWTRGGGAEDHLVAITGMTEAGEFILCDPAHPDNKPVIVTGEQLELFMSGKSDANALWVDGTPDATTTAN